MGLKTIHIEARVKIEIAVMRERGFDFTSADIIVFDSTLTKDITRVVTTNSLNAAGTFSIDLAQIEASEIITPQSLVKIFFNGNLEMIGLVDTAKGRVSIDGGGKPNLTTNISGRDLMKVFIETKFAFNEFAETVLRNELGEVGGAVWVKPSTILAEFFLSTEDAEGRSSTPTKQNEMYKAFYDVIFKGTATREGIYSQVKNISGNRTQFVFASGLSFGDLFGDSFNFVSDNFIFNGINIDPGVLTQEQSTLINIWKMFSVEPISEVYMDTVSKRMSVETMRKDFRTVKGKDRFELIARPHPFLKDGLGNPFFDRLPTHVIDRIQIREMQTNRTDQNTRNVIMLNPPVRIAQSIQSVFSVPGMNLESVIRHGTKFWNIDLRYFTPDILSKNSRLLKKLADDFKDAYGFDYEKFQLTATITPTNDIRIGEKVLFDIPAKREYYVEAVTKTFDYPKGFNFSLVCTRGQTPPKDPIEPGNRFG